jgi:UDP-N-acetylglucosamine/UDP-N-acetylgalactosamine diphosphorylase
MLNQRPIFLGGQGGLVGPCRLEFGTVIAAGSINRKDELRSGRLLFEQGIKGGNQPFIPGRYFNIKRITVNNIIYIANLIALEHWYNNVRSQFVSVDFPQPLYDGLKEKLNMVFDERIKRFKDLCEKMQESGKAHIKNSKENASQQVLDQKNDLFKRWPELEESFNLYRSTEVNEGLKASFLEKIISGIKTSGKDYISVIKGLNIEDSETGTRWLQGIVDRITAEILNIIPSFK